MSNYHPHLIPKLSYPQILEMMFETYAEEYGTRKFEKVAKKALGGSSVISLIQHAKVNKHRISKNELLESLASHPYFWLAKPRTMAIGALMVLNAWDIHINSKVQIYSQSEMQSLASSMMAEVLI
jgi:hypothetical protein